MAAASHVSAVVQRNQHAAFACAQVLYGIPGSDVTNAPNQLATWVLNAIFIFGLMVGGAAGVSLHMAAFEKHGYMRIVLPAMLCRRCTSTTNNPGSKGTGVMPGPTDLQWALPSRPATSLISYDRQ